jgi:hypothetical protein
VEWVNEEFDVAMIDGPRPTRGFVYRGLGLHLVSSGYKSRKGRKRIPPMWRLTHLGSGHGVSTLRGELVDVLPVATEIAEAGDWTFDGLDGWKNQFPDARERMAEITGRHGKLIRATTGMGHCPEVAQQIAIARA